MFYIFPFPPYKTHILLQAVNSLKARTLCLWCPLQLEWGMKNGDEDLSASGRIKI